MKKHTVRAAIRNAKLVEAWYKEQAELKKIEDRILHTNAVTDAWKAMNKQFYAMHLFKLAAATLIQEKYLNPTAQIHDVTYFEVEEKGTP